MSRKEEEVVGDLFVTQDTLMLKLLPTRRSGSLPIRWFSEGCVTDHGAAAEDIARLVGKLRRKTHVVRGLTVMTDKGLRFNLVRSGLPRAVRKAGFEFIN